MGNQESELTTTVEDNSKPASGLRKLASQGSRYLIVGFSSAAIELALFFALHVLLAIDVVLANVVAIFVATIYNFVLSRKWTFGSVSSLLRSVLLYLALFAWNQFFSSWAIVILIDLGLHAMLAKIITMGCIVCWNFVLYRQVVFK